MANNVNPTLRENEEYMRPSTRLRKLISQEGVCIQAPGVYDGICARIAIEQGFQVMVRGGSIRYPLHPLPPRPIQPPRHADTVNCGL